jgi:polyhydroxybutyrate depolymerase
VCPPDSVSAGDQSFELEHDGLSRQYILHVPESYAGEASPLILNFHGFNSNATEQQLFSQMNETAEAGGFAVAYPEGLANSWNAGACCGQAVSQNLDDVGFARAVVADIAKHMCIDPKRVFSTGMSNGGFLSHRIGCEAADMFAAIGPVAGVLGIPPADCKPPRPVPVIHFHGTADPIVSYDGGAPFYFVSVADTIEGWASRDSCQGAPETTFRNGSAQCETYARCGARAEVTLCSIEGEGHCWPGQSFCPEPYGASSTDISANDEMWKFFQAHPLP